jgi:hypothetical protein
MARSTKKNPKKSRTKKPTKKPAKKPAKGLAKKPAKGLTKKPAKRLAKKPAKGSTRARNADGFMVEEDGRVELMFDLSFEKDPKVRVSPELAKRIMDGEFDGQDVTDIPEIEIDDLLNVPIQLDGVVEVYPPPPGWESPRGDGESSDGPHRGSDVDDGHVEEEDDGELVDYAPEF